LLKALSTSESKVEISWVEPEIGGGFYPIGEYFVEWTSSSNSRSNSTIVVGVELDPQKAITCKLKQKYFF